MCFRVVCNKCGKYSWSGCGKHLVSIYANIETGNHCMCRPWPGVSIPTENNTVDAQQPPSASATTAAPDLPPMNGILSYVASFKAMLTRML